jgi:ABC-type transport system involved in multi-copper enzyme maturation permease subunit
MKRINPRINPIYLKEIKIGVRTKKAAIILLLYNGLLALFGLFFFYVTFDAGSRYTGRINYSEILSIYLVIVAVEFGLVLFTVPGLTSSTISGEREKQTLDILLTTTLSPLQIIIGKLASSISIMITLAISSLPILALVFSIGGITMLDFVEFLALIIVTAIFIGSIGIFFSTFYKRTTPATVSSYGAILVLVAGTFAVLWALSIIAELRLANQVITDGFYYRPDIGNWALLLLINPAVTCYSMLIDQTGTGYELGKFIGRFGTVPDFVINNWFIISIVIQLLISGILILWAAWLLDPLRKKAKRGLGEARK